MDSTITTEPRPRQAPPPARRRARPRAIVTLAGLALVLVTLPVLLIVFGIRSIHHSEEIARDGVTVTATVTSANGYRTYCTTADVSYSTVDGTPETATVATDGCLPVGSRVGVRYDPHADDVAVLAVKAGGPTGGASGGVISGVAILVLEGWFVGYVVWVSRRRGRQFRFWREVKARRTPHGIALAAALVIVWELAAAYFAFGSAGPRALGYTAAGFAALALGYLTVPRGFAARGVSLRRRRGADRAASYVITGAWFATFVVALAVPRSVDDTAARLIATPHRAVITQVEVNTDRQGGTSRNYAVTVDDGEHLALGSVTDADVGTVGVGAVVTAYVDPHHILNTDVPASGFDQGEQIVGVALLVLLLLNLGVYAWVRTRPTTADAPAGEVPIGGAAAGTGPRPSPHPRPSPY